MSKTWFLIVVFLVWCRYMWLALDGYKKILARRKERETSPDVPEIAALNRMFRQHDWQKFILSLLLDLLATLMFIMIALLGLHIRRS